MIGNGYFESDPDDSAGVRMIADLAGHVDDIYESDPDDSEGIRLRASAMPNPNYPPEGDVRLDVLYGYDLEFRGTLPD